MYRQFDEIYPNLSFRDIIVEANLKHSYEKLINGNPFIEDVFHNLGSKTMHVNNVFPL